MPQIFEMSNSAEAEKGLSTAIEILTAGGLVAVPTETVYGLAADATHGAGVAAIFAAKGRPRFNPLIVHVPALAEGTKIGIFSSTALKLAEAFWPGPLTVVVPLRSPTEIADLVTGGLATIALRVPADAVAQALLRGFGRPLAAPSANRSGRISPTTAAHVAADLGDTVGCILDAGPTIVGIESTIVGLAGSPRLLRPGGVPRDAIEAVLGERLATSPAGAAPEAPGMLASHYAPMAKLRLDAADVRPGEALLAFGPAVPANAEVAAATVNLSPSGDLVEAAARLFGALRELDRTAETIAVAPVPPTGLGEAINDRLRRAAAPRR